MDTVRYGLVIQFITTKDVQKGEQFLSFYYLRDPEVECSNPNSPRWYVEGWNEFKEKYPEKASDYLKTIFEENSDMIKVIGK